MGKTETTINRDTNEVIMVREFDAPRSLVWDAFTKPEMVAKWWGPRAFSTEVREMQVKPGGVWHYVMHGTGDELKGTEFEGMEAGGKAFYSEVVEGELLVYKDVFVDKEGNQVPNMPEVMSSFKFEDKGDKTVVTMLSKYATAEELQKVVEMGFEQGMSESLEKLDELLASSK